MASLGAAAGTLARCRCHGLTSAHRFQMQVTFSVPSRSLICRADSQRNSQGRISKNAVDTSAASLNSTADDAAEEVKVNSKPLRSAEKKSKGVQDKKSGLPLEQILMQRLKLDKAVEEIVGFMAPREKGDIRDVILMSLSFAVLVYISQRLVCAYCVLRHMMNHS